MLRSLIVILVVAAIGAAGLIFSGVYNVSADSPDSPLTDWLFSKIMHASVARRAKDVSVPDLEDAEMQLVGAGDFDFMCASCHGAPGRRADPAGQGLNPAPPDLAESAAHMTPGELFWITKHGIRMTGMPAWGATHGDGDLWPVVAFMTVLPELDGKAYQSMLKRAEGRGHHAVKSDNHHDADTGDQDLSEATEPESPTHDHAAHSH